jgi:hypothetical protein
MRAWLFPMIRNHLIHLMHHQRLSYMLKVLVQMLQLVKLPPYDD